MSQPSANASKAGLTRNPISLRLYKVLNASYDDKALQEALEILDDVYEVRGAALHGESEAMRGMKDVDSDDQPKATDLRSAAAKARNSLKRDIEIRGSQGSQRFLRIFKHINSVSHA